MTKTKTKLPTPLVTATAAEIIAQIEVSLGLSYRTLSHLPTATDTQRRILADTSKIVELFVRIQDEQMRQLCIEFIQVVLKPTLRVSRKSKDKAQKADRSLI